LGEIDIKAIEKSGDLTVLQRVKMTTLAEMSAVAQIGERRAQVTGITALGGGGRFDGGGGPGGGRVSSSVSYMNYGTLVNAKASGDADRILVQLEVEKSGPGTADSGPIIGEGSDGQKVRASAMNTIKAQATVALKSGDTVLVSGSASREGGSTGGQIVLLTARVVK
jgi:hypothetical protein